MGDFVTLENAKIYSGIDKQETKHNPILEMLINMATEKIKKSLSRDIEEIHYNEQYDIGDYQTVLQLNNYPIISIAGVTNNETTLTATQYEAYVDEGCLRINSDYWYKGRQKVNVTYSAGFTAIPQPIQWATLELVMRAFYNRGKGNLKSFDDGIIKWTRDDFVMGLDADILGKISSFRKFA